jgi:hypothetical protein
MKKYFRTSVFVVVLALMLVGIGQPGSRAALDRPGSDPACRRLCEELNLQCFLSAVKKSDQHRCTAEYRNCIAHCK